MDVLEAVKGEPLEEEQKPKDVEKNIRDELQIRLLDALDSVKEDDEEQVVLSVLGYAKLSMEQFQTAAQGSGSNKTLAELASHLDFDYPDTPEDSPKAEVEQLKA